ncbi:NAD(P)/FAD-dependent oxidoreductase [Fimbriimonas ginsengisoli]|uniref:FAD dependent oxidoreductase n=1 Tax=Fimbriimonas ginsengisoli Gsoil 348 TaxID=661478 RepID=A0A068NL54_FIMGI|nr:FAD-dependent oxidoreductase [Fimbriimonas ginsengisoli]AIE84206.1 FAD dependent oxidoreductase [Fimbriimonas ginsengisoli Gsoil 348]
MAGKHVVVIGAGVIGLCAAEAMLRRGFRVTILERDAEPGNGCSYGNGGIVVPSHFVPLAAPGMMAMGIKMMANRRSPFGFDRPWNLEALDWTVRFMRASNQAHVARSAPLLRDLNLASRAIYEELVVGMAPEVGYEERGLLMLCQTAKALDAEARLAEDANKLGLKAVVLDGQGVAAVEPNVWMEVAGGVHFLDDAHLTPATFMREMRGRILAAGGEIRDGLAGDDFRTADNHIQAAGGVEADEFVLATGAWSGQVARKLGLRLPMLAGKGYGLTVANPPETPSLPAILVEARIAVTPMTDGVRFVGTMELGPPGLRQNPARVEGIRSSIPRYYPNFTPGSLEKSPVWTGLRPCSPDGLPYIGRPKRYRNLIVATGHAMMGMSLGPISGKLVAELAANDTPSIALNLLSPDRYA